MINWFSGKLKDIFHLALSGYVHLSHNFTNLVFLTSSLLLSIAGLQLTSRRPQLGQVFPLSMETYLFFLQIVPFFLCLFLISTSIGALSVGWKPSLLLSPFLWVSQIPRISLHNQLALTKFGRRLRYPTIDVKSAGYRQKKALQPVGPGEEVVLAKISRFAKTKVAKLLPKFFATRRVTRVTLLVLILTFWRDNVSRGCVFAISTEKYEKRALNFAISSVLNIILFFKTSELFKISR